MIQVDYYTGAADKLTIACRICTKVVQQMQRMLILSDDALQLTQLDKLLWTFSSVSFVPHCFVDNQLSPVTPIVLGAPTQIRPETLNYIILLNFHDEILPYYQYVNRVIEIVDQTPMDKEKARKRYRIYQAQGCDIRHHNLDS